MNRCTGCSVIGKLSLYAVITSLIFRKNPFQTNLTSLISGSCYACTSEYIVIFTIFQRIRYSGFRIDKIHSKHISQCHTHIRSIYFQPFARRRIQFQTNRVFNHPSVTTHLEYQIPGLHSNRIGQFFLIAKERPVYAPSIRERFLATQHFAIQRISRPFTKPQRVMRNIRSGCRIFDTGGKCLTFQGNHDSFRFGTNRIRHRYGK